MTTTATTVVVRALLNPRNINRGHTLDPEGVDRIGVRQSDERQGGVAHF